MRFGMIVMTLALSAGGVVAQPVLDFQVSQDGASWSKSLAANSGETVQVRARVLWEGVTAYGFGGVHMKLRMQGVLAADTTNIRLTTSGTDLSFGRVAPFNYPPPMSIGTVLSGGTRLYHALSFSGQPGFAGVAQAPPVTVNGNVNTDYTTSTSVVIVQFGYTIRSGESRVIDFDALISNSASGTSGPQFAFHATSADQSTSFRLQGTVSGASVTVPSPSALALTGLVGLIVARRRR